LITNSEGRSALYWAVHSTAWKLDQIPFVHRDGWKPDRALLVRRLLESGADPNARAHGMTLLHMLCLDLWQL
jgi:hypothetical protein